MTKIKISDLKIGDKIMPPAREVRLWMRRYCDENGLPEEALHLTVSSVKEGVPDKCGRWMIISADYSDDWNAGRSKQHPFIFKSRPETLWQLA